jgi:hypothetical protein
MSFASTVIYGTPAGFGGLQIVHRNVDKLVDNASFACIIVDVSVGYGGLPCLPKKQAYLPKLLKSLNCILFR